MFYKETFGNLEAFVCKALNSQKINARPQGLQNCNSLCFAVNDLKIDDFDDSNLRKIRYSVSFRVDVFDKQRHTLVWSRVYCPRLGSEYWNVVISKRTKKIKKIPSINEILESS